MRITSITYSRTVNLGNYNSERLEATVELGPLPATSSPEERDEALTSLNQATEGFYFAKSWVLDKLKLREEE